MSVSISLYELTKKHDLDAYVDQCVEADDVMVKGFQTTIDKLIVDLQKNLPAELKPVRIVKVLLFTSLPDPVKLKFEPPQEKTNNLVMRKHRCFDAFAP